MNNTLRHDEEDRRERKARENRQYVKAAWYAAYHMLRKARRELLFIETGRGF